MAFQIVTIPCLSDNYAFLLRDSDAGVTAVIDVPDHQPILAELETRGWKLDQIILTHHHFDHIEGVAPLVEATGAKVIGGKADAHRLPKLDTQVSEGDTVMVGGLKGHVIDVSGHTVGHLAFHFPEANAVFTADSLMALGCGRIFEGDPEMMWASLSKLVALPPETTVCSGHEYTASNAKFALTIEPGNADLQARAKAVDAAVAAGTPTVPSTLAEELATNPFLRARLPEVKAAIGMEGASDVATFTEIRARKDNF
ncbi:hydroxyacylglutathione hydrolase [Oceanibium sediminis]|uniref:hydroxyacylglutathione hydrolase n=1 Tax=Oceanibium sediminis TaxID=2026339 RepID=UPI000DD47167|nr:hydroxyacylglutathione hydrolase [Oceanibium sediminis]